jgi:hypothetical protein
LNVIAPEQGDFRMQDKHTSEDPAVKRPTEARQGRIVRGGAVRRILMISLALVVVAFLVIYFAFAS